MMKKMLMVIAVLVCIAGTASDAAVITWRDTLPVWSASDVIAEGALVEAVNCYLEANLPYVTETSPTVNGVLFTGTKDFLPVSLADPKFDLYSGDTGDSGYNDLLSSVDFGGGGIYFTKDDLGGENLVSGNEYLIQIWYVDDRDGTDNRVMQYGDGNGNTVQLTAGDVRYVIGTFTADDQNQTLSFDAIDFDNAHLTAYQIREYEDRAATDVSPTGDAVDSSTTAITWNPPTGYTPEVGYDLVVRKDTEAREPNFAALDNTIEILDATATSPESVTLDADSTYWCSLTAYEPNGVTSDASDDTPHTFVWSFTTVSNDNPPENVDAGPNIETWANEPTQLFGSYTDDAVSAVTVTWTSSDPNAVFTDESVVYNGNGIYSAYATMTTDWAARNTTVTLTVEDEYNEAVSDTTNVDVWGSPCRMTRNLPDAENPVADIDADCDIDLVDLSIVAADWLLDYELSSPVELIP